MPARGATATRPTAAEPPVFVEAVLDPKPWGSQNLARLGLSLPPHATIGEALFTAPQARIATGSHAGSTLGDLARHNPETWIGASGLAATRDQIVFPLLVKVIDAHQDLSIQVHPTNALAAAGDDGLGKTEAWHILAAEPESILYLGLSNQADEARFTRACRQGHGEAATLMRQLPARAGDTYVVPAGTPHAIGAGIMIYEIQQPSSITYRLDDWGRVDAAGVPRSLHIEAGLATLDGQSRPTAIPDLELQRAAPRRELLAATRYFALERITFAPGDRWNLGAVESPQVLTVPHGLLHVKSGQWAAALRPWQTLVTPVRRMLELTAEHPGVLLRGWVPDLDTDVLAPARTAGASERTLTALGVHVQG